MVTPQANGGHMTYTFIVEHLDPELEEWQTLEYNTIYKESEANGHKFLLSGLSPSFAGSKGLSLPETSKTSRTAESMYPGDAKQRVCLLDPKAEKDIGPEDADSFDAFLFGGILGDDPPRDRTGDLRKLGFPGRRLGPEQMTTDTAVRVTRMVVQNGMTLAEIPFIDRPEFHIPSAPGPDGKAGPVETIDMPFKYVRDTATGQPILPDGMLDLLAKDADKDILDLL
ncbi:arginine N-methyltransferase SFM1 [Lecanosticta acicola]|uniref:Arginine N-methyltransferase SFM1 n=1 Tax=Lecanosticta acicola TaxID=111012 RepID=A0AAI8YZY8_9PEZI|nr:arginine N-methyltransferase SFM1 [Lecanosticta acicola]